MLQPQTLWWFTTGFILTMSRFYNSATPPTIVVMPILTLIVLLLCWLMKQKIDGSISKYFLWGTVLGISAATRLDISLFIGIPLIFLILRWSGIRAILPVLAGVTISFFITDPFMWFMPIQHVMDLLYKFTLHYSDFHQTRMIPWYEWANGVPLAVISIVWFLALLIRRRLGNVVPTQVLIVVLGLSLLASLILATSKFQSIRYLFPILVIWEIFLPMFAQQEYPYTIDHASTRTGLLDKKAVWVILGFIIPTQILGYFISIFT
jgi:hypothetical protein